MATRQTAGRTRHDSRPARESLSKRLGRTAKLIAARDGHRCVYCGATAEESGAHLHLDHVIPKSCGGTDTADNLVACCRSCNCTRKAMSLPEWSRYVAATLDLHPRIITRRVRRQLARELPLAA